MSKRYTTTEIALQRSRTARNSDWDLYFEVFELEGAPIPIDLQKRLRNCTMPETISRTRRTLQHKMGLYPADEVVEDKRFENYEQAKHSRGETVVQIPVVDGMEQGRLL